MNSPLKTKWLCRLCYKYLSSKRSYDEHMNIHNESRPFACDQCSYAAASQMTLRRHKLRNHIPRQEWGYQCPYCVEAYMEPASYQQHVLTRHFGHSATFGCPHNGCAFTTKSSKHFREHYTKHIVVMSNQRQPSTATARRFSALRPDINMATYLVDDELGSGHGKEAVKPVARRVSNLLVLSKKPSNIGKKDSMFANCLRNSKSFMLSDKDFLKTPINLDAIDISNSSKPINQRLTPAPMPTKYEYVTHEESIQHNQDSSNMQRVLPRILNFDEMSMNPKLEECWDFPNPIPDWIESEVVIDTAIDQPQLLPDGQIDIELD
ncbi:PR domain zinc finger protein 16 [Ditylenchus destructor]|uniref:PR domain zinc finger protein 16 n=1 Tax=Ditylenchus destructor TaxID=166010 RepID=A0AAD4NEW1_9BILA|nr:PR domain zinc finger protein 16 [Ditylenchus destructor]